MILKYRLLGVILIALLLTCGCSSGSDDPAAPAVTDPTSTIVGDLNGDREQAANTDGRHLWGYWQVHVDTALNEVMAVPLRSLEAHFDITGLLMNPEICPLGCIWFLLGLQDYEWEWDPEGHPGETILVDVIRVQLTNPLGPEFTGFDVRGIAMFNGSHLFPASSMIVADALQGPDVIELCNANGFTPLWDSPETTANLNGYKYFFTGTSHLINYRHYFDQTMVENHYYLSDTGPTSFTFEFAVDANWAPGTPPYDPFDDFPRNANCPEPWNIETSVDPTPGIYNVGGSAELTIEVYDYDLDPYNPPPYDPDDQLPIVECPELFIGTLPTTHAGSGFDPIYGYYEKYEVDIPNYNLAPPGRYKVLVSVQDYEVPSQTAYKIACIDVEFLDLYLPYLKAADGTDYGVYNQVTLTWHPLSPMITYYVYRLDYDFDEAIWYYEDLGHTQESFFIDENARQTNEGWFSQYVEETVPMYDLIDARIAYFVLPVLEYNGEPWLQGIGATDYGYPIERELWLRAYIIDWYDWDLYQWFPTWFDDDVYTDIDNLNQFFMQYGIRFSIMGNEPVHIQLSNDYWDIEDEDEAIELHNLVLDDPDYGYSYNDCLSLYYVWSIDGDTEGSMYAWSDEWPVTCQSEYQNSINTCIVMGAEIWGEWPDYNNVSSANLLARAIGRLFDISELDSNPNDEYLVQDLTCSVNDWCTDYPDDPWYCNKLAAYPRESLYGTPKHNVMWQYEGGRPPHMYDFLDAQGVFFGEWLRDYKDNWHGY